ncbi:MAG: type II toxin-antitoxin system HicB family antitoxin [Synergistaceae bacterium]|nr:type II toxin-antitoxin system HicB family antitoxin [Synergistaceae bacterium]
MTTNILTYKGYYTKIRFSAEDNVLHGILEDIGDLVNFESNTVEGIIKEFHSAVDDYIEFCREWGKEPEKPSSLPLTDDYNDSQTKIAV